MIMFHMTGTTCTVLDPVRDKRGRGAVIQTLRWGGGGPSLSPPLL